MIEFRDVEVIQKGWGRERVIANNELYCGKMLCYDKAGAVSSAHFHLKKTETFYVNSGSFVLYYWDHLGNRKAKGVGINVVIHIPAGMPHQLFCQEPGVIFEVSTPHSDDDVVRIAPGDSQKAKAWKCPICGHLNEVVPQWARCENMHCLENRPESEKELSRLRAEHGVYE